MSDLTLDMDDLQTAWVDFMCDCSNRSLSYEEAVEAFAAIIAAHDEEVRADERGKITIENWPKFQCDSCGYPVYSDGKYWRCVICANDGQEPVAAARGDGANGSVGGVQTVARGDGADPWINPTPKDVHHDN